MDTPHCDAALAYARAVVAGEIPNCKWVRLAAQRHLDDLAREDDEDFPYYFDREEGERVAAFIECLPHVKGQWARERELIRLQPWQSFIVVCLFGWRRAADMRRRFRSAYLKIPRKNGKSVLAAGIGLWMFLGDDEFGAEVYSGATTEKQAWEVFRPAKLMLEKSPDVIEASGAEVWAKTLVVPGDGSRFEPIIGKPGDGASPSCGIIDEFHEHDTPDMLDTLQTGMGAREQPLLLGITTAGYNLAGPCYEMELQAQRVLEGVLDNPELFTLMYGLDVGDDWADPAVLAKANPNIGVSVSREFLEAQQRDARNVPANQTRFRTKHCNEWCAAGTQWINLTLWTLAGDKALAVEELVAVRAEAFVSADLASKVDLASSQILFRRQLAGQWHYYLFGRYWLPEETLEEAGPNQAAYKRWLIEGWLTVTPGATIDFDTIAETVVEDIKRTGAREFIFDPFNAVHLSQMVAAEGGDSLAVVEFNQKPWHFAVPMDEITSALKDGRFHHDGNPITTWCFANVVAKRAKKDMFSPTKERPENKIDGAVAAIMAMSRAQVIEEQAPGVDAWLRNAIVSR